MRFFKYFRTKLFKCALGRRILVVAYKMKNIVKLNDRF